MSFLAELKQRKVFRVGALYLVVAWVAIQAASIALPAFDAPAWALRVVILVFALGFPLALLLAWALELTPEGLSFAASKVGNKRMASLAAGLVALALAWYFVGQPAVRQQRLAAERSIAVLPFVNMSGDKANEYFSDGLAETTLDMLAQVPDLKVIARTSSFAFKGKHADMREIGKALDAAHLLEGSVQQAGDTVRVTAQLIRVSDGSHLWSKRFDRKLADVFAIQDEIATEVVRAIQGALPAAQQARLVRKRTDNVAAYDEYLKGIALLPGRKVPEMRRALAHFQRAATLEPRFAQAHAMAARTHNLLGRYSTDYPDWDTDALREANLALRLDSHSSVAHSVKAMTHWWRGNDESALTSARHAVALAPASGDAHFTLSFLLMTVNGTTAESLALLRRAVALDPLNPDLHDWLARELLSVGAYDEAKLHAKRELELAPDTYKSWMLQSTLQSIDGDFVKSLRSASRAAKLDPNNAEVQFDYCAILLDFSATSEFNVCIDQFIASNKNPVWLSYAETYKAMLANDSPRRLIAQKSLIARDNNELFFALAANHLWNEAWGHVEKAKLLNFEARKELYPEQLRLLMTAARTARGLGNDKLATGYFDRAILALQQRGAGNSPNQRGWQLAIAYAYAGQNKKACMELEEAVRANAFTGIALELDADPLLSDLRALSCYTEALTPARRRARFETDTARAAGLLDRFRSSAPSTPASPSAH